MSDPVLALIVTVFAAVAVVALFWPWSGLAWRLLRSVRPDRRALVEDALKHLYDCEYRGHTATLHSLAGALRISGDRAAAILERLESQQLAVPSGAGYRLTEEGRRRALRVIRIHRLWERYFADETGVAATEWHAEAERREHRTTERQAEALEARMGYPRFDPHGDPIPTADGEIPPPSGRPLSDLPVGRVGEIIHIEDEPEAVYAQLVATGLHPGMRARVTSASPDGIVLESELEEHVLSPVAATNVHVVPLPTEERIEAKPDTLSDLSPGESATVVGISRACRGPERRRMLDLGVVPGTRIAVEMRSPAGDPTAYRIRGAMIALRRDQAAWIRIERHDPAVRKGRPAEGGRA